MTAQELPLAGTRGERRFAALNPRGGIDFYLPSSSVNDYLDMITAHGNYWSDPNFAAFLLTETFKAEDEEGGDGGEADKAGGKDASGAGK